MKRKYYFQYAYIVAAIFMLVIVTPMVIENSMFINTAKSADASIKVVTRKGESIFWDTYIVYVNFQTDTGKQIDLTTEKNVYPFLDIVSQKQPVLYDPKQPKHAILADFQDYWLFYWGQPIFLGIGSILVLINGVNMILHRKKKAATKLLK